MRPLSLPKAESAFSRYSSVQDTTIGWRFVNRLMKARYGVDSMPETAENVATDYRIDRESQDRMALASQQKALAAQQSGFFDAEIVPVHTPQKKGDPLVANRDEHPRDTTLEALARLKGVVRPEGTVTAGNASGVNDGACALLLADEATAARHGLVPRARVVAMATAGVPPRTMGMGPAPATRKVLALAGLTLADLDVIELNEAFAAQGLAVLRDLGLPDDDPRVNPNGGAIALGPSAGRVGRAAGHHGGEPVAPHRGPLRALHHVHRRGAGDRGGAGAGLTGGRNAMIVRLLIFALVLALALFPCPLLWNATSFPSWSAKAPSRH